MRLAQVPRRSRLFLSRVSGHQHATMSVIGIDFGNRYSTIAQAKRGGIDIILNENSKRLNRWD